MRCTHCGKELNPDERFCTTCGHAVEKSQDDSSQNTEPYYPTNSQGNNGHDRPLVYSSDYSQVPGKFNWGAFAMTVPWGIGNRVYICILALIPGLNIIMAFLAGFMGNEWAMENNHYRDIEEFSKIQGTWNRAGFVFFIIAIIPIAFFLLIGALNLMTLPILTSEWL